MKCFNDFNIFSKGVLFLTIEFFFFYNSLSLNCWLNIRLMVFYILGSPKDLASKKSKSFDDFKKNWEDGR